MRERERREAALKRAADELQHPLEYMLRNRPRMLKRVRREYADFCIRQYRVIERAAKVRQ